MYSGGDFLKLGEKIRRYRILNNMTMKDLAEKLGMSIGAIQKYENGTVIPKADIVQELAVIFNTSISNLIEDDKTELEKILLLLIEKTQNNNLKWENITEEIKNDGIIINTLKLKSANRDDIIEKYLSKAYKTESKEITYIILSFKKELGDLTTQELNNLDKEYNLFLFFINKGDCFFITDSNVFDCWDFIESLDFKYKTNPIIVPETIEKRIDELLFSLYESFETGEYSTETQFLFSVLEDLQK